MIEGTYTDPLKAGDHFGDYVVERQLGSGAMGAVYLVRAPDDSLFAVKIMFPGKMTHDLRSRFAREADFAMKIRHRNLISVYDVGEDPDTGLCYIIMDYVAGGTLSDIIKARGKLPVDEAVKIAVQISAALDVAHKNGLVHRDVKPDNIMFDADGTPKLADLGVAKFDDDRKTMVTMTGMVIGTPAYMSPEQLMDSHRIDSRADIYSLGVVLYEMLAGTRPNSNSTAVELLAKAIKGEPLPDIRKMCPEISAAIAHVLSLMCAPKPEDRPATSIDAANLLHKAATGKLALPKSANEIALDQVTKRKRAIAVSLVVVGLLMFLVGGLVGITYAILRYYAEDSAQPKSVVAGTVEDSASIDSMVVTNVVEKIVVVTNGRERAVDMTNVNAAEDAQGGNPAQADKLVFNKAVPKFKMQVHANDLTWLKKSLKDDQSRPVRICHDFSHGGFPSLGQAFYRSVFEKIKGFESKACWYDLTSENLSVVNVLFLPSTPAQLLYDDKECVVIDEFMQKGGTVIVEAGEQDNDIWRINKLLSRYGLEVFVADEYRSDSKAGRTIARKVSTCCMALDGLTPEFRFCTFAAPIDGEGEKSWSCLAHVNERPVIAARSVGNGHLLFSSVGWKWWKDGVGQMDRDASEMWKRIILSAVESKPIPLKAPIGQRPCTDAPVTLRAGPISIYTSRMFKKNAEKLREIVIQALPHLERRCGKVLNPEEMSTTKFILSGTSIWGCLPVGDKTVVTSATFRGFPDKIGFLSRFIFGSMVSNALGNIYLSRYLSKYVALLVLGDLGFPEELTRCIDDGRQQDNDFTKYRYTDKGLVDKNGEKVEDKNNFIANAKFLSAFEEIRSRHADFVERFALQLKVQPSRFLGMSESVVLLSAATGEGCISIFERYGIECRHKGYAGATECVSDSKSESMLTKSSPRRITRTDTGHDKTNNMSSFIKLQPTTECETYVKKMEKWLSRIVIRLDARMGGTFLPSLTNREVRVILQRGSANSQKSDGDICCQVDRIESEFERGGGDLSFDLIERLIAKALDMRGTGHEIQTRETTILCCLAESVYRDIFGSEYDSANTGRDELNWAVNIDPQMNRYNETGRMIAKGARSLSRRDSEKMARAKFRWLIDELNRNNADILAAYFKVRRQEVLSSRLKSPVSIDDIAALFSIAAGVELFEWFTKHGMRVSEAGSKIVIPERIKAKAPLEKPVEVKWS